MWIHPAISANWWKANFGKVLPFESFNQFPDRSQNRKTKSKTIEHNFVKDIHWKTCTEISQDKTRKRLKDDLRWPPFNDRVKYRHLSLYLLLITSIYAAYSLQGVIMRFVFSFFVQILCVRTIPLSYKPPPKQLSFRSLWFFSRCIGISCVRAFGHTRCFVPQTQSSRGSSMHTLVLQSNYWYR